MQALGFTRISVVQIAIALSLLSCAVTQSCGWRPGPKQVVRIAGTNAPPFMMRDPKGGYSGPAYELFQRAAQRAKVEVIWTNPKQDLLHDLGPVYDIATSVPKLAPYIGKMYFSRPWIVTEFILLSRRGSRLNERHLSEPLVIGLPRHGVSADVALRFAPKAQIEKFDYIPEAVAAVCAGKLDASVATSRTAPAVLLQRPEICGAQPLDWTPLPDSRFDVAAVAAPGFESTVDAIRAELGPMAREGEVTQIYSAHPTAASDVAMFLAMGELERQDRNARASSMLFAVFAVAALFGMYMVGQGRAIALRQSREARAASQAKSDFVAMISHELRTPVHGFLGMTSLLLESPLTAGQREMAQSALEAAKHLHLLLNDVLDLAKIEAGKLEIVSAPFALRALLQQCAASLRVTLRDKPVELLLTGLETCPEWVLGDEKCLRQVLINLGSNAVKFTDQGQIELSISAEPQGEGQSLLRFAVRDTGIGIAADQVPLLFSRFTQVGSPGDERRTGTGLGLSIVRELLRLMGSEVAVKSELGRGSEFGFKLCMRTTGPVRVTEAPVVAQKLRGKVLVAEDNLVNRRVVSSFLERLGLEYVLVADGALAVEAFQREDFCLVLMDCQMPNLDGFQATKQIREMDQGRRVPIVALTANTTAEDRERCRQVGMDDFLAKPFRMDALAEVLGRWLPQERLELMAEGKGGNEFGGAERNRTAE